MAGRCDDFGALTFRELEKRIPGLATHVIGFGHSDLIRELVESFRNAAQCFL